MHSTSGATFQVLALLATYACLAPAYRHGITSDDLSKALDQEKPTSLEGARTEVNASSGAACGVEFSADYMQRYRAGNGITTPFYPTSEHCMASHGGNSKDEYCLVPDTRWSTLTSCGGTNQIVAVGILAPSWEKKVTKKDRNLCTECKQSTPCHPWALCPKNSQRFLYYEKVIKGDCERQFTPQANALYDAPTKAALAKLRGLNAGAPTSGTCQCGCGSRDGCPAGQCKQPASGFCRSACRPCCVGEEIGTATSGAINTAKSTKCKATDHLRIEQEAKREAILQEHIQRKRKLDQAGGARAILNEFVATCLPNQMAEEEATQKKQGSVSYKISQMMQRMSNNVGGYAAKLRTKTDYQIAHMSAAIETLGIHLSDRAALRQCLASPEFGHCSNLFSHGLCKGMLC